MVHYVIAKSALHPGVELSSCIVAVVGEMTANIIRDDEGDRESRRQPSLLVVPPSGPVTAHALRLHPGEPLMPSLRSAADVILARQPPEKCSAVFVMTCVGSLKDVTLRLANASRVTTDDDEDDGQQSSINSMPSTGGQSLGKSKGSSNDIRRWKQRFEIVSMVGTFSRDGGCHLHLSLSDAEGNTIGGHCIDGDVFTTVELVLGTADGIEFSRQQDEKTGYRELIPLQLPKASQSSEWWHWAKQIASTFLLGVAFGTAIQARAHARKS